MTELGYKPKKYRMIAIICKAESDLYEKKILKQEINVFVLNLFTFTVRGTRCFKVLGEMYFLRF